ncbi:PREDICTED: uncharacterized protein LOC109193555 isoform X2 [Ipomoea nil]|uniref:uncharacterized protein LOC109193555 isoform X2 n=1 Tax=Ipomoea nil TaxID=35883 RepID=UPI000900E4D9|nr:PREDICTED: uncharacterized protein LOC109193555 isoform X2 [Ipomoea nil]
MGEHLVLCVDRLITPESVQTLQWSESAGASGGSSCSPKDHKVDIEDLKVEDAGEDKPLLLQSVECRICQEEDDLSNLEVPCACSGSLKFAHRKCVQRWCNEKGDITCEICHQPYQPGYTAPPPPPSDDTDTDISPRWTMAGAQLDINDPRLLAMVERRLLETDNDEYADSSASGAAFCRSAALILMALLLLRHAMTLGNGDGDADDEVSTFFSLFLLRAAGFLLPCYIVAWAISILQRRRQRQEAAEVTFVLPAGQRRGLHVTITPGPPVPAAVPEAPTPHQQLL